MATKTVKISIVSSETIKFRMILNSDSFIHTPFGKIYNNLRFVIWKPLILAISQKLSREMYTYNKSLSCWTTIDCIITNCTVSSQNSRVFEAELSNLDKVLVTVEVYSKIELNSLFLQKKAPSEIFDKVSLIGSVATRLILFIILPKYWL